jgi:hypothetical protein
MWLPSALRRVSGGMVFDSLAGDAKLINVLILSIQPSI